MNTKFMRVTAEAYFEYPEGEAPSEDELLKQTGVALCNAGAYEASGVVGNTLEDYVLHIRSIVEEALSNHEGDREEQESYIFNAIAHGKDPWLEDEERLADVIRHTKSLNKKATLKGLAFQAMLQDALNDLNREV